MGFLSDLFHPGRPYADAQRTMEQYYNQGQQTLNPYNQTGMGAGRTLTGMLGQLSDPVALQNKWIESYETSPAAKQAQDQAMQSGLSAASSMGLMGSTPALQALQGGASNISLADRQNYLNDLMQKYTTGAQIGGQMYGIGAQTAGQSANLANQMGQAAGAMQYGQGSAGGNMLGSLLGRGIGAIGSAIGGRLFGGMGGNTPWSTTGR